MKKKHILYIVFAIIFVFNIFIAPAVKASEDITILYSGNSGDLQWSIDKNGHFILSGSGDYNHSNMPWIDKHNMTIHTAEVNVKNITSLSKLFEGCVNLKSVNLSNLDTSKVYDMNEIFSSCWNLESLDLNNFNTENVIRMSSMFSECWSLKSLDLSSFDTQNVTDMSNMFFNCESLNSIDLTSFNTQKVSNMNYMFSGCYNLKKLDLSSFDCSSLESYHSMLSDASIREIYTPINVKADIILPSYNFPWISSNNDVYTHLPSNFSQSFYIYVKTLKTPGNVNSKLYGYNDVAVSWNKVSNADGYIVYYKKISDENYEKYISTINTNVNFENLPDGGRYRFKIVPYFETSTGLFKSPNASTTEVVTLKEMSIPSITITSSNKIKISWTNIPGESGYQISRSTSNNGTNIISTYETTTGTNKLFSPINGKTYYKVRAYKTVDNEKIYTPWSTPVKCIYFNKPQNVVAKLYGYNDVNVSWSTVSKATGYRVYYKNSSSSTYKNYISTSKTNLKFRNLNDGIKYNFKIVPYYVDDGKIRESSNTSLANIYTLKKLSTPKVVKQSSKQVKVSWTNISGETGYQISQSTTKTGTNIVSTYKTTTGKSKLISATKGKKYYYKIRAYKTVDDKKIYGPWSTTVKYVIK